MSAPVRQVSLQSETPQNRQTGNLEGRDVEAAIPPTGGYGCCFAATTLGTIPAAAAGALAGLIFLAPGSMLWHNSGQYEDSDLALFMGKTITAWGITIGGIVAISTYVALVKMGMNSGDNSNR